jgi:hypothetical protein
MNIRFLIELSCTVHYLVQKKTGNFKIKDSITVISADNMSGLEAKQILNRMKMKTSIIVTAAS